MINGWIGLTLTKEDDGHYQAEWDNGAKVTFTNWGIEQPSKIIKNRKVSNYENLVNLLDGSSCTN